MLPTEPPRHRPPGVHPLHQLGHQGSFSSCLFLATSAIRKQREKERSIHTPCCMRSWHSVAKHSLSRSSFGLKRCRQIPCRSSAWIYCLQKCRQFRPCENPAKATDARLKPKTPRAASMTSRASELEPISRQVGGLVAPSPRCSAPGQIQKCGLPILQLVDGAPKRDHPDHSGAAQKRRCHVTVLHPWKRRLLP